MATKRRMGSENSETRSALMDAVENVMREDGYGALTARSVAERAGLKHQLVYYYFQTLDDLLIATYERHMDGYLSRIEEALRSDRPLHTFLQVHASPTDATLNSEFLSMANHNESIRTRTIAFGEKVRLLGMDKLGKRFRAPKGGEGVVNPFAVTMVVTSVCSILGLEYAIGIAGGHAETRALLDWCVDQLEP